MQNIMYYAGKTNEKYEDKTQITGAALIQGLINYSKKIRDYATYKKDADEFCTLFLYYHPTDIIRPFFDIDGYDEESTTFDAATDKRKQQELLEIILPNFPLATSDDYYTVTNHRFCTLKNKFKYSYTIYIDKYKTTCSELLKLSLALDLHDKYNVDNAVYNFTGSRKLRCFNQYKHIKGFGQIYNQPYIFSANPEDPAYYQGPQMRPTHKQLELSITERYEKCILLTAHDDFKDYVCTLKQVKVYDKDSHKKIIKKPNESKYPDCSQDEELLAEQEIDRRLYPYFKNCITEKQMTDYETWFKLMVACCNIGCSFTFFDHMSYIKTLHNPGSYNYDNNKRFWVGILRSHDPGNDAHDAEMRKKKDPKFLAIFEMAKNITGWTHKQKTSRYSIGTIFDLCKKANQEAFFRCQSNDVFSLVDSLISFDFFTGDEIMETTFAKIFHTKNPNAFMYTEVYEKTYFYLLNSYGVFKPDMQYSILKQRMSETFFELLILPSKIIKDNIQNEINVMKVDIKQKTQAAYLDDIDDIAKPEQPDPMAQLALLTKRLKIYKTHIDKLTKFINKPVNLASMITCFRGTNAYNKLDVYDKFNANPMIIGFENGVYDFENKRFRNGEISDLCTITTGINYGEPHPDDLDELQIILSQLIVDPDDRKYVLYCIAQALTGNTAHVMYTLIGTGRNGKSILLNMIAKLLHNYCDTMNVDTLTAQKRAAANNANPELFDKRFCRIVTMNETNQNEPLNNAVTKTMTGGDIIKCRQLYGSNISYIPLFTIFVSTNEFLIFDADSYAMAQRQVIIPFSSTFCDAGYPATIDEQYAQRIFPKNNQLEKNVAAGKYSLALFKILLDHMYISKPEKPEAILLKTKEALRYNSPVQSFFDDFLEIARASDVMKGSDLFDMFKINDFDAFEYTSKIFYEKLTNVCKERSALCKTKTTERGKQFYGVKIRSDKKVKKVKQESNISTFGLDIETEVTE